jgi:hypothetical protein
MGRDKIGAMNAHQAGAAEKELHINYGGEGDYFGYALQNPIGDRMGRPPLNVSNPVAYE